MHCLTSKGAKSLHPPKILGEPEIKTVGERGIENSKFPKMGKYREENAAVRMAAPRN